jgi:hypothetical protein
MDRGGLRHQGIEYSILPVLQGLSTHIIFHPSFFVNIITINMQNLCHLIFRFARLFSGWNYHYTGILIFADFTSGTLVNTHVYIPVTFLSLFG